MRTWNRMNIKHYFMTTCKKENKKIQNLKLLCYRYHTFKNYPVLYFYFYLYHRYYGLGWAMLSYLNACNLEQLVFRHDLLSRLKWRRLGPC